MGDAVGDPDRLRKTDHQRESAERTVPPFPAQLRRLRVQRGMSLADLARRTHYSKGYLSKIETGAKPVTTDVARRCDEVLGAGGELLRMARETEVPPPEARVRTAVCRPSRRRTRAGSSAGSGRRPSWSSGSSNGSVAGR
ncbi:helix-turn-helix transcriptional regulator [Streptomyces sp. ISL-94]|uniref:helix-turn-helix domain-containing protein n=1 Tax=Streptomyces sp. ISL-94 TaxID=2819190 RepID=UPI0027E448DD|nr:helix-turn-helix transcriptional regulator [Streptomyces sp. ISL-94]